MEADRDVGVAVNNAGSLYVSDFHNDVIRKLTIADNSFPARVVGASSAVQTLYLETTATETITSITVPQSQGGKQEYSIATISPSHRHIPDNGGFCFRW
jgi:trimeric autotransporter adhesin